MKRISLYLAAIICLAGCSFTTKEHNSIALNNHSNKKKDNGPAVTRVYELRGNYTELQVTDAFAVTMSDSVTSPTITLDSALHKSLIFTIHEGELKIGLKPGEYRNVKVARVALPVNSRLNDIELKRASSFTTYHPLNAGEVSIDLEAASCFVGDIASAREVDIDASAASQYRGIIQQASHVEVDLSGASNATISGAANTLSIDLNAASQLSAERFDAQVVEGELNGASQASVLVCKSINIEARSASKLEYSTEGCNPVVNINTTGASTATRK